MFLENVIGKRLCIQSYKY